MKYAIRLCVLAAVALFCVPLLTDSGPAQAAPQSYKLKCRGGNNVGLSYYLDMPTGSTSINAATLLSKYEIRLQFQKSPVSGGQDIPEGTCAWMDRPFNSVEYARLRWLKAPFPTQVSLYPSIHKYGTIKVGNIYDDASASTWRTYMDKIGKSTEYFYFWGYWQSPWLYVTKVGP